MAQNPKSYTRVPEAEELIKELCKKYPDVLWCVKPENITVLGVENKKRGKATKDLARIKVINGVQRAILKINDINIKYCLELYWLDWNVWTSELKQWVIMDMLMAITADADKVNKPDIRDYKIIVDAVGANWMSEDAKLPNLLDTVVKFDLDLRPGLEDDEATEGTENTDKPAKKKSKKAKVDTKDVEPVELGEA